MKYFSNVITDMRARHKSEATMANYISFALLGLGIMAVILHQPG